MVLGFTGAIANIAIGVISVALLVISAEIAVAKMEGVAKHFGISEVVIAVTVISIGTSLPELSLHLVGSVDILLSSGVELGVGLDPVNFLLGSHSGYIEILAHQGHISSTTAIESVDAYQGISGTVLGSNAGSNIVQQTLIFSLVVVSSILMSSRNGFHFSRKFLIRDYAPLIATTLMTLILALNWQGVFNFLAGGHIQAAGTLTRLDGLVLVGSFVAYMAYLFTTRGEALTHQGDVESSERPLFDLFMGIVAMLMVVVSAEIFLRVVELAVENTGISGSMIGVATVGIVSAFPEMITALTGLKNGSEGISLGTLIGSNITNPLLAIGSGALISTYAVPRPLVLWDLPFDAASASLLIIYLFSRKKIGFYLSKPMERLGFEKKAERLRSVDNRVLSIGGAVMLAAIYLVYLYVRFTYFKYDFA